MPLIVTREQARQDRNHYVTPEGVPAWINNYLGRNVTQQAARATAGALDAGDEIFPVAFLVEQEPGPALRVHFHVADQFQVMFPGDGSFSHRPITRPLVQFASAYAAYGPIAAGRDTLLYFTLRNGKDPGGRFLPECREEIARAGVRPRSAQAEIAEAPARPVTPVAEPLIAQDASGLFATTFTLPPGAGFDTPDPASGRGQYWLVLAGSCSVQERELDELGLWFVHPSEPPGRIHAGVNGARLLALQFPRQSRTDPDHPMEKTA